jgi:hypothetical protein
VTVYRGADCDVEASKPFGGVRNFQAPRTGCLGQCDTRGSDDACQEHDQPWQAHLTPA